MSETALTFLNLIIENVPTDDFRGPQSLRICSILFFLWVCLKLMSPKEQRLPVLNQIRWKVINILEWQTGVSYEICPGVNFSYLSY